MEVDIGCLWKVSLLFKWEIFHLHLCWRVIFNTLNLYLPQFYTFSSSHLTFIYIYIDISWHVHSFFPTTNKESPSLGGGCFFFPAKKPIGRCGSWRVKQGSQGVLPLSLEVGAVKHLNYDWMDVPLEGRKVNVDQVVIGSMAYFTYPYKWSIPWGELTHWS